MVLSRLLLPEEYGFVALITVFTGFVATFTDAGLSFLIIRSDYNLLFFRSINFLAFFIGILLTLLVIILAYPIALFYNNNALILPTIILSVNLLIGSLAAVPFGILSKKLKFNAMGQIELFRTALEISIMIILAYLKFSYWALVIAPIAGGIFRVFLYNRKADIRFKLMKMKYLRVAIRKAKSIVGHLTSFNLINYWASNADNLIVGKIYGAGSLGIYNRAYNLLSMAIGMITNLFGKILMPSLKDLANRGGDVNKEYMNTLGVISIINYPLSILFILFAKPLVILLWSETWIQVAELLPYIGVLILVRTLNSTTGHIFILYNKH
jgi:PST family polysaccharide transporter